MTVSDLTERIRGTLEGGFRQIWVTGEISNLRRQASGHCYFSLKDKDSQLSCVLFRGDAARQEMELRDGVEVVIMGGISVYPPRGTYQLIARVVLESGAGRLQAEFERLKKTLAAEGLFDRERKRALPMVPRRVAVITSPTGAALQDFLRILRRREFGGTVTVYPARVQGAEAMGELRDMLRRAMEHRPDVILLTRGGGSIEDLWAFNDADLVRMVATSPIPVISAVGHEIDFVLTDFAADVRAETPSGAAELLSSGQVEVKRRLREVNYRFQTQVSTRLGECRAQLERMGLELRNVHPARVIERAHFRVDDLSDQLKAALKDFTAAEKDRLQRLERRFDRVAPSRRLGLARRDLEALALRMKTARASRLRSFAKDLSSLEVRLRSNDLQSILNRGFAILQDGEGQHVPDLATARDRAASGLRVRLRDGVLAVRETQDEGA